MPVLRYCATCCNALFPNWEKIGKHFTIPSAAHAVHSNISDKHDPINRPYINKGPVIKIHANQKYTTDGDSGTVFETLCKNADVPHQKFVNCSDLVGGSTLGNVSTGQVDIRTVDIGNPMFGMHSVREKGGVTDNTCVRNVFTYFFEL